MKLTLAKVLARKQYPETILYLKWHISKECSEGLIKDIMVNSKPDLFSTNLWYFITYILEFPFSRWFIFVATLQFCRQWLQWLLPGWALADIVLFLFSWCRWFVCCMWLWYIQIILLTCYLVTFDLGYIFKLTVLSVWTKLLTYNKFVHQEYLQSSYGTFSVGHIGPEDQYFIRAENTIITNIYAGVSLKIDNRCCKTYLKWPLKNRQNKSLKDMW